MQCPYTDTLNLDATFGEYATSDQFLCDPPHLSCDSLKKEVLTGLSAMSCLPPSPSWSPEFITQVQHAVVPPPLWNAEAVLPVPYVPLPVLHSLPTVKYTVAGEENPWLFLDRAELGRLSATCRKALVLAASNTQKWQWQFSVSNMKGEAPKKEARKEEVPKSQAPKEEDPKSEVHKEEAPKKEAPREEVPKSEEPKEEVPKKEKKEEATKTEGPKEEVLTDRVFKISLDRSGGASLGMTHRMREDGLFIVRIEEGLLASWNSKAAEGARVESGDMIIQVNSVSGSGMQLREEIIKSERLTITILYGDSRMPAGEQSAGPAGIGH